MGYQVLTDGDVRERLSVADAIPVMAEALRDHAAGDLRAPPRWSLDVDGGSLVFTVGATPDAMGFRAYETVDGGDGHQQLVSVWDTREGLFRGCVVGHEVGIRRTAGINGVAVDRLARDDARVLGVLGTGTQASAGARAACAVREFDRVRAYSPTREHREAFADRLSGPLGVPVEATSDPEEVVRDADVLYCATDSREPVFEAEWLPDGALVSSLGPKFRDAHELPLGVVDRADLVVTDSLAQVEGYADYAAPFFLDDATDLLVELGDLVAEDPIDRRSEDVTLFCSVGLAGTEVALTDAIFDSD